MAKLFGTDGVRGVAGVYPMEPEFALKFGKAAGVLVCQNAKKVAICRDTRASGQMLEAAMTAGFNVVGVDVVSLGVLPTPSMTGQIHELGVDMGVIITASHNKASDNGIKIIKNDGNRFEKETLEELEGLVVGDEVCTPYQNYNSEQSLGSSSSPAGGEVSFGQLEFDDNGAKRYVERIMNILPSEGALKGLRVVVDCANGAMHDVLPMVYKNYGAGVITLGNTPDGYNINKDCGSQHSENLIKAVVEAKADLGIAVDGDGDRIVMCDEKGNLIDCDQFAAFLGKMFKEQGKLKGNAVVTTVVSNLGLAKYLKSIGIDYYASWVGEPSIIAKMREIGANVGGEESGHMILLDHGKSGDALAVSLMVAYNVLKSGKRMSEIFPLFELMPKKRTDVTFAKKENMQIAVDDAEVKKVIEDCRAEMGDRGQILVRPSGTEPKVQVWVWGEDPAEAEAVNKKIVEVITKFAVVG